MSLDTSIMAEEIYIGFSLELAKLLSPRYSPDGHALNTCMNLEIERYLKSPSYISPAAFAKTVAELIAETCVASHFMENGGRTLCVFVDVVDVSVKTKFQYINHPLRKH